MSELTDRLRVIARNASPGPWSYDAAEVVAEGAYNIAEGKPWYVVEVYDNGESGVQGGDDGRYIATFDPVLVGRMLDVIDAAEALVDAPRGSPNGEGLGRAKVRDRLARFREVAG